MKKTFKFIILVTLVFIGMQSCIYDEEPTNATLPQGIQMGFTIHVGGNKLDSRDAGDGTLVGDDLENKIDIENRDFKVYIYQNNDADTYIGELEIISVLGDITDNDGYNNDYYVVGRVKFEEGYSVEDMNTDDGFHLVVMANLGNWAVRTPDTENSQNYVCKMGYYPERPSYTITNKNTYDQCYHYGLGAKSNNTTFDQSYDDHAGYIVREDKLIPMWGCQTYNEDLKENTITQLGEPINMLRTLAKIEVLCDLDNAGLSPIGGKIRSVGLTLHHTNVRIEQLKDENVQFDATQTDHTTPNIRNNGADRSAANSHITFTEQGSINNLQKFIIYIPEMSKDLNRDNNIRPDIKVTIGWDENQTKEFTFPVGNEKGERIDVLRNHIYRYTIQDIAVSPVINYQVVNWDSHTIDIEFK